MTEATAMGDTRRRYLEEPEDSSAPLLRVVLEASESPSQHRVFVYLEDKLLGQLPAMSVDVDVRPGEIAMLTFRLRVSKHAQVKSAEYVNRVPRDPSR